MCDEKIKSPQPYSTPLGTENATRKPYEKQCQL